MSKQWIGDYFWKCGPLVIGPASTRETMLAQPVAAKALARKRAVLSAANVGGDSIWVLGGNARPVRVWTFGTECIVLVRVKRYADIVTRLPTAIAFHPAWADGKYKRIAGTFDISAGDALLFDTRGKDPDQPGPRPDDPCFGFPLAGGTWKAFKQEVTYERVDFIVIKLVRDGHEPVIEVAAGRPPEPEALVATDAMVRAAKRLEFVETDGGPVLVLPLAHKTEWFGVNDADGEYAFESKPTDYDRACEVNEVIEAIPVGASEAWVLPSPDPVAFHPVEEGGLLLRWVGADNGTSVLAGALLAPEALWYDTGQVLTSEGSFAIVDAAKDGRDDKPCTTFKLPAGRYAVWSMREFNGDVRIGKTQHETMVTAIRLRRL